MGAHTKSMSWYMGPPSSPAPGSTTGEAQHALSSSSSAGGSDASFDANMVIILAALLFALLFALGLNSLARFLIRWVRRASADGGGQLVSGGLKKRALRSIPIEVYGGCSGGACGAADDVCAICLGEFADGEKVRVLPRCGHGFHVRCVDTWLASHDSCPTCRASVLNGAATKAAASGEASRQAGSNGEAAAVTVIIA